MKTLAMKILKIKPNSTTMKPGYSVILVFIAGNKIDNKEKTEIAQYIHLIIGELIEDLRAFQVEERKEGCIC